MTVFCYFLIAICIFLIGYPSLLIFLKKSSKFNYLYPDDTDFMEVMLVTFAFVSFCAVWIAFIPIVVILILSYELIKWINKKL